ncbi:MAG: NAD(P)-binding domain-containing protein [Candidatus Heimdallarchaeota archaeon]|nr:NAD(P)-binding domain-containing protein [Candidatus Heimdallarchaeota archaeon]
MSEHTIGLVPGTGKQSKGIALQLGKAGYNIIIGSRSIEKAEIIANELNSILGEKKFIGKQNNEVVRNCNVIFLVVPPEYLEGTLAEIKPHFQPGTILVDVVVPLKFELGLAFCDHEKEYNGKKYPSISEYIRANIPEAIFLVGGFKTISAIKLNRIIEPLNVDVFLTSDSLEAKEILRKILEKIDGLRVLDAGPLIYSRTTEQMTALVININKLNKLKHGSYKIITTKNKNQQ